MLSRTAILLVLAAVACGKSKSNNPPAAAPPAEPVEAGDSAVFAADRVLSVDITIPEEKWTTLRTTGRDFSSLATECKGPAAKIYAYHSADVAIDGESFGAVEVRKKGFLGSLTVLKPSLKLRLDATRADQRYHGTKRLTLNNNQQDDTLMRTCLTYKVFADAKIPAPRCNFARVRVNGAELGIYSNVEPIKKPFLRRHFGDDSGVLYEGQLADFSGPLLDQFEQKTTPANRAPLEQLARALDAPDAELVAAVSKHVDLDEFVTFWALEALAGMWDGYSSNRNNFYLYQSPSDGKLHFIPWGPDMSFTSGDPFHSPKRPVTVSVASRLTARLYAQPAMRTRYVARMRELLDAVWNEKALLAEVDRIEALLGGAPADKGVAEIRTFITGRKAAMEPELAAGGGTWAEKEDAGRCFTTGAKISGTFETTFGTIDAAIPMSVGKATLALTVGGNTIPLAPLGVVSGHDERMGSLPVVRFVGMHEGSIYGVQLIFERTLFRSGEVQPFHGFATWGTVFQLVKMKEFKGWGFLGQGAIKLEQAGTADSDVVKGSFEGTIYEPPAS